MWAVGLFLFLLGIILVIVAPMGKKKNARCSEQAPAELMKVSKGTDSEGFEYTVHLYSYNVDGVEYKLESKFHCPGAKEVGDKCSLWYNPKKPSEAMCIRNDSSKIFNILLIIGIVSIPLGLVLIVAGMG